MSRACIPFRILFDKELSKNEIIIYGLIEHMESDGKNVFFNNRTIAQKLGVSHESKIVQKMIAHLTKKGYIKREHKEVPIKIKGHVRMQWRWCLSTVKNIVVDSEDNDNDDQGGVPELPPPTGVPELPPPTGVPELPPYNNPSSTSPLTTTTRSGSGFNEFEIKALKLKLPTDERSPEEFLENVYHHIENNSDKEKPVFQRQQMILKLLAALRNSQGKFYSNGFVSESMKAEAKAAKVKQKDLILWSSYQSYVNSPIEKDLRKRGIAKLESFEIWKTKNA